MYAYSPTSPTQKNYLTEEGKALLDKEKDYDTEMDI